MFRSLLISVVISANLFGWPQAPKDHQAATDAAAKAAKSNRTVPPTHVSIDSPLLTADTQPVPPESRNNTKGKPLPWFTEFTQPEWVIVYVTAIYSIIAGLTLIAIKRQGNLLKQQVEDAAIFNTQAATVASGTLNAIQTQAKLMEQNLAAAKENIEIFISRERARIRVELESLELNSSPEDLVLAHEVRYRVEFFGLTPAFIAEGRIRALTSDSPEPDYSSIDVPVSLPSVMTPSSPTIAKRTFLFPSIKLTQAEISSIMERKRFVHFSGSITYKDIFDRDRETKFRYRWTIFDSPIGTGSMSGYWAKAGKESDNSQT